MKCDLAVMGCFSELQRERMVMPITMRTKLKVWQQRQTWKSARGVTDVQQTPGGGGRAGRAPGGPRSPGMGTFSAWTGLGLPQGIHQSGPFEPHTFNGCVLFSCDFNSVELTF